MFPFTDKETGKNINYLLHVNQEASSRSRTTNPMFSGLNRNEDLLLRRQNENLGLIQN